MMFCCSEDCGKVDFWWVKPRGDGPSELERETLRRHSKGPYRNAASKSRRFCQPLADIFEQGALMGGWRFGIEVASAHGGPEAPRAFIQQEGRTGRLFVHLIWQEDWTANPFARSKYMKGKLVYQKVVGAVQYFSRQYEIHDGNVLIADREERAWESLLPLEGVKDLWVLQPQQHTLRNSQ